MAGSVQFYNVNDVKRAFQDRDCEAWSIWQHKQFMFKGIGDAEFTNVIDLLANGASNAIYTVKVYEDIDDAKKIKSNTPDDGSFNFRLNEEKMTVAGYQQTRLSNDESLREKITQLERQLQERDQEGDEEEKTIGAVIGDTLIEAIQDPAKMLMWVDLFKNIFKPGPTNPNPPGQLRSLPFSAPAATVGNINPDEIKPLSQAEMERIAIAMDKLEKKDPKIVDHLEELARMAEKNPSQFKFVLGMLDTMLI